MVEMNAQDNERSLTTSTRPEAEQKADTKMTVDQTAEKLKTLSMEAKASIEPNPNGPIVLIVMGMAGSGKTTFVHVSESSID